MKKWMLAAAVMLIFVYSDLAPFESMDAGELCVVETLFVEKRGTRIRLLSEETEGVGETIAEAVEHMKENAAGRLFLRQVQRVVFCNGAEEFVDMLELPWEIPLGAGVYQSESSAEDLMKDLNGLEGRLKVMEQQKNKVPTLAQLKNMQLQGE